MSLCGRHYVIQSEALRLQRELYIVWVQLAVEFNINTDEFLIVEEAVLGYGFEDVSFELNFLCTRKHRLGLSCVVPTEVWSVRETGGVVVRVGSMVLHRLCYSRSLLFLHISMPSYLVQTTFWYNPPK